MISSCIPAPGLRSRRRPHDAPRHKDDEEVEKERLDRAKPLWTVPLGVPAELVVPTWLDFFFDLTFVASLSIFTSTHQASRGEDVGYYVCYVTVLWWSWSSIILYDIRYARPDYLRYIVKLCQLTVFAFIAAYARGFRPTVHAIHYDVVQAGLGNAREPTQRILNAVSSWRGMALAYALGRFILFLQYLWVVLFARKRTNWSLILPMAATLISGLVFLGLHTFTAYSERQAAVRLGVAGATIALEIIVTLIAAPLPSLAPKNLHLLLERYGLLTLYILGEGLIGLTSVYGIVVSAFGFSNRAYLQLFCSVIAYALVWQVIFDPLSKASHMGPIRHTVWALLHLPLHITLLLWLESAAAVILWTNLDTAFYKIVDIIFALGQSLRTAPTLTLTFPRDELADIAYDLQLLGFSLGGFNASLTTRLEIFNQTLNNLRLLDPNADLTGEANEYIRSIIYAVGGQLLVSLMSKPDLSDLIDSKFAIPSFEPSSRVTLNDYLEFVTLLYNQLTPASLFTFPTLGGIVIMSGIISMVQHPPRDRFDWLLTLPRMAVGTTLLLLTLLNLGRPGFTQNDFLYATLSGSGDGIPDDLSRIYSLLFAGWVLPIQVILLGLLVLFEVGVLHFAKRAHRQDHEAADEPDPEKPPDASADHSTEGPLVKASSASSAAGEDPSSVAVRHPAAAKGSVDEAGPD